MPKFNYLGKQGFPNAGNVNVYKYDNNMDYDRFNYSQMRLTVCNVPWDLGEAHIGNRHIDGVGNVVHFGTKAKRDAWFNSLPDTECFRWETKFKELHRDGKITIPLPFDVAARYNYVFVEYNLFANDNSKVEYESAEGVQKWCYFVRNVVFDSPNTTTLEVIDDVWQTFIYDISVTGMILERGHAPLFATDTDTYLSNPLDNSQYLLTEDVSYGNLQRVAKAQACVLNSDNVMACFAATSNILGNWDNKTPGLETSNISGVPSVQVWCCPATNIDTVIQELEGSRPQFKQTVQGIFFIESRYLSLGQSFTLGGIACNIVNGGAGQVSRDLLSRSKADWGYESRYQGLAKLYTFPYSAIEICDQDGDTTLVRIEDTTGPLTLDVSANLVIPYINLSAVIKGIGGASQTTVKFSNITERTFKGSGRWYGMVKTWEVPTFAVTLDAATQYDYSTRFDRVQAQNDATTDKGIAERDASTVKTNADATATTARSNAYTMASTTSSNIQNSAITQEACEDNSADNVVDNAASQVTCNNSVTIASSSAAGTDTYLANELAVALQAWNAGYIRETTNDEIDAANQTTSIGVGSAIIGGAVSGAVSGATMGGLAGAGLGAVGGAFSGVISGVTSSMQNNVATNLKSSIAETTIENSGETLTATNNNNTSRTDNQNTANGRINDAQNTLTTTSAANTSAAMKENAAMTRGRAVDNAQATETAEKANAQATETTEKANNTRNYDTGISDAADSYNNALARIQNHVNQAALGKPSVYGSVSSADSATTRPQALFANIVTQSKAAIKQAGDEFLRYGYRLDQFWEFDGNWCVGKHFTYWKLKDYWVRSNDMQDYYQDAIRFFLMGGVTVWAKPEEIGAVSIYDNGK